jgi:hypothetical protein
MLLDELETTLAVLSGAPLLQQTDWKGLNRRLQNVRTLLTGDVAQPAPARVPGFKAAQLTRQRQ